MHPWLPMVVKDSSSAVQRGDEEDKIKIEVTGKRMYKSQIKDEEKEEEAEEDDEDLARSKASAAGAWFLNLSLVVYIVWLYRRPRTIQQEPANKKDIMTILGRQLQEESDTLDTDSQLKQELRREALEMARISTRVELLRANEGSERQDARKWMAPLVSELRQSVSRKQQLLSRRDDALRYNLKETATNLQGVEYQKPTPVAKVDSDDAWLGTAVTGLSGILAGIDVSFASETISLAVLLSLAAKSLGPKDPAQAPNSANVPDEERPKAVPEGLPKKVEAKLIEEHLRKKLLLRFYGRWDDEQDWVLLQHVRLTGVSQYVVGLVHRSKVWMGPWSQKILTALVARSARGLVRRRGWRPMVEQTQQEVGRSFALGYLVETAADEAVTYIPVNSDSIQVCEVPKASVLRDL